MRCKVANCKSENKRRACDISFFSFPADEKLAKKWVQFCRRENAFNTKTSYVCMKHFTTEDIQNNRQFEMGLAKKRLLKHGVVPSIYTKDAENSLRAVSVHHGEYKHIVSELLQQSESVAANEDDNIPSTSSGRTLQEPAIRTSNVLTAAEIKQRWNFAKVIRTLGTTEQCVQFAEDNGLILRSKLCARHRTQMTLQMRGCLGIFRCRKESCRDKSGVSRASGTWFENAKISLPHIFHIMYGYAHHWSNAMTREEKAPTPCVLPSLVLREILRIFQ